MELAGLAGRGGLCTDPNGHHDPPAAVNWPSRRYRWRVRLGTTRAEARLLWNLLLANQFAGTPGRPLPLVKRRWLSRANLQPAPADAYTLNDLESIFAYVDAGRTDDALATLRQAHCQWIELGNRPIQADNLSIYGHYPVYEGDFRQSQRNSG